MQIYLTEVSIKQDAQQMWDYAIDPAWHWTASNGVEYCTRGGKIWPEPEQHKVRHGCDDLECDHDECWTESVPVTADGEEIRPPRVMQSFQVFGKMYATGRGHVEGLVDYMDLSRGLRVFGFDDVLGFRDQYRKDLEKLGFEGFVITNAHSSRGAIDIEVAFVPSGKQS